MVLRLWYSKSFLDLHPIWAQTRLFTPSTCGLEVNPLINTILEEDWARFKCQVPKT